MCYSEIIFYSNQSCSNVKIIHYTRENFKAFNNGESVYDIADSYKIFLDMVTKGGGNPI